VAKDDQLMLSSYDDLQAYLRREDILYAAVPQHQAVEISVRSQPVEGTMVIFWPSDPVLLQLMVLLSCTVPVERVGALESALLRLNHTLTIPGFGYNHANGTIYFRLTFPRHLDGHMEEEELRRAIQTGLNTVTEFWSPLQRLLHEGADLESVLHSSARGVPT
jgi:hypothetical protein